LYGVVTASIEESLADIHRQAAWTAEEFTAFWEQSENE
jgi:hypothetical protein